MNLHNVACTALWENHNSGGCHCWLQLVRPSLFVATMFLGSTAIVRPRKAPLPGYELAWAEEFDGTVLDKGKWGYRTDSKHLSTQKPENVSVTNGVLRLQLKKEAAGGKNYTGAGIVSREEFKYGYFEVRMKML